MVQKTHRSVIQGKIEYEYSEYAVGDHCSFYRCAGENVEYLPQSGNQEQEKHDQILLRIDPGSTDHANKKDGKNGCHDRIDQHEMDISADV